MNATRQSRWFMPLVFLGGILFGFGLGFSRMARPEVVLSFLQFKDLGLLFVIGAAALIAGVAFHLATRFLDKAPLTGKRYGLWLEGFDRNVVIGGVIFGVGWGLSGVCPGAAYASLGIGNFPILIGIAGMFAGAYIQAYLRSGREAS